MANSTTTSPPAGITSRWAGIVSFIVTLVGLGISIYLTVEHYSAKPNYACPESATINCLKVTTSRWSHVGPIPVAVLGLVFFIGMGILCVPPAWRIRLLDPVRIAGAIVGVLVALILLWIELFKVDAICLYCTAVHICSLILLTAVLWTTNTVRSGSADPR
jgi:uncharacterized membrane protein